MARVRATAIALLFVWQTVTYEGAVGNCVNGFIQQDLLRTLVSSGSASTTRLNSELRLIPDWNFTCNGTITSFLMGTDIRTSGTLYPEVQIWRRTSLGSSVREYTKVWSEMVRLDPGYFSPSGVLEYRLNNSFNFQTGDIFGVYQPPLSNSVVRIYYKNDDNTAPIAYRRTGSNALGSNYNIDSGFTIQRDQFLLISPVTDSLCASAFLNSTALQQKAYDVKLFNDRRRFNQRVFPDINFTCSGNLTKWIVGGTVGSAAGGEVQIWRRNNGSDNDYTKVGYSILNATDPDGDRVYEHIPDPPLQFQEGDILGVYQQQGYGRMRVYYQALTGPANYRRNLNVNPPVPSTLNNPILVPHQYDYPLVTVEIISVSTPTSKIEDNTHTLSMSTTFTTCATLVSDTLLGLSKSAEITTGPSQLPALGVSGTAVGGAIAALLILAVLAAAGITILVVVLVRRHDEGKSTNCTSHHPPVLEELSAQQIDLEQNVCYASSSSYPLVLEQSTGHVQLQQNVCYVTTSSSNQKDKENDDTDDHHFCRYMYI